MALRAAAAKLETLAKNHTGNSDTADLYLALSEIAGSLFLEFAHLHERLDRLDAALNQRENRPYPEPASKQ